MVVVEDSHNIEAAEPEEEAEPEDEPSAGESASLVEIADADEAREEADNTIGEERVETNPQVSPGKPANYGKGFTRGDLVFWACHQNTRQEVCRDNIAATRRRYGFEWYC